MADKRISQLIERTDIANNDVLPIVASGATTTNKVTVSTLQEWMQDNLDVGVTSVGLSMPSAFVVSASPVTTSGNIAVTGAGTVSQYIRGDGSLADFPQSSGGGGASVSYYLNGSVSQGTIGGVAYLEMSKTPVLGAGTNFTINANGYIASFITDAGDPNLLLIPGGNWNFETYFAASSGGGTPSFYVELYKVSGSTATLVASNSANPELIAFGTTTTAYFSSLAVPATTLTLTDRLALRYYVTHAGRTITLHTENSNLCQIITTFTTGLTALNGLTAQVQNFATGTSGTDFNISSTSATHTFNIPTASATNRGLLSSADWTSFSSDKVPYSGATGAVNLGYNALSASQININGGSPTGGSYLGFKHSTSVTTGTDGYTSMYTFGTNNIGFQSVNSTNIKDFTLSMVNITPNVPGGRVYNLPDASGTLALTSDLGNYIQGSGTADSIPKFTGTRTIANSAIRDTTSTVVISKNVSVDNGASQAINLTPASGGTTNRIETTGTLPLSLVTSGSSITLAAGGVTPQFTLTSAGNVGIGTSSPSTYSGWGGLDIRGTNGGHIIVANTGGTNRGEIFTDSNGFNVSAQTNNALLLKTNDTTRLTISSTGAATFSQPGNPSLTLTGTDGAYTSQLFLNSAGGGTSKIIANGGTNTLVLATNNVDRLSISSTGAAIFSSSVQSANILVNTTTNDGYISVNGNNSSRVFYGQGGSSFPSGNSLFRLDAGGIIAFQILGSGAATFSSSVTANGALTVNEDGAGTKVISIRSNFAGVDPAINVSTNNALLLQTNNTERMRITSGGALVVGNGGSIDSGGAAAGDIAVSANAQKIGYIPSSTSNRGYFEPYDGSGFVNIVSTFATAGIRFMTGNSATERMRIKSNGEIGFNSNSSEGDAGLGTISIGHLAGNYGWIQTWSSTSMYLNRLGNAVYAGTQRIDNNSDERIKENISPIDNALTTVLSLQGKKFNMLDEDDVLRYGFVAQEVQPHLPDFVTESERSFEKDDVKIENLLTLENSGAAWAAILVEAIKEQQEQIKSLTEQVEALKSQING